MADQDIEATEPPAVEDPQVRVNRLRNELAEAQASVPPPPGFTMIKVSHPHETFSFGSTYVGPVATPVPNTLVPSLYRAADEAGVTLTEEGS